jgi:hypothetical protein
LAPASAKAIAVLLEPLCWVYGTPVNWENAAGIYIDMLRQPETVIAEAVRQHIQTSRWFPKPAELLDLCKELRWPLEAELEDAQAALEWAKSPEFGRTKAQLMAERRTMYGENVGSNWDEWFNMVLGYVPPVPTPPDPAMLAVLRPGPRRIELPPISRERWEAAQKHPHGHDPVLAHALTPARSPGDSRLRSGTACTRATRPSSR